MAQSRKLGVQLRRVVQLAVVHQNVFLPALIQHHGLAAVFQIHHSQPRMDQRRMAVQVYSPAGPARGVQGFSAFGSKLGSWLQSYLGPR